MRTLCVALTIATLAQGAAALDRVPAADKDWESLISYRPSQPLQLELAVRSVTGSAWRPLRVENGLGVINLDFYGIEITRMPVVSGKTLDQLQLLAFIRGNFGILIDPTQSDFRAYNAVDAAKWASIDPTGAVMRFGLKFKNINVEGGSVVVGDATPDHWRFTTIYSEKDWKHPVSGSREFGVMSLADGRMIVYTMGTDRPTSYWDNYVTESAAGAVKSILKQSGFDSMAAFIPSLLQSGEKIWEEYQRRVVSLVNASGGEAHALEPVTRRPEWPVVGPYFHPTTSWLGDYAAVIWSGPQGEDILPVKTNLGRAIGQVNAESDHPRGVMWVDGNFNGISDPGETTYLPDETKPSEVTDLGRDGVAVGMLGRRYVSPRAVLWPMGSAVQRVVVPASQYARFDAWIAGDRIAGTMQVATPGGGDFTSISRAFVWNDKNANRAIDADELTFLTPLVPGFPSEVNAASSGGLVVGTALDANKAVRATLWKDGEVITLGAFTTGNSSPMAINDVPQAVGYADVKGGTHAFLWQSNALVDLGTLGGKNSYANSINAHGAIVGSAEDTTGQRHGVLWKGTQPEDLGMSVLPTAGLLITDARFIDDNGVILVTGRQGGLVRSAFLIPLH